MVISNFKKSMLLWTFICGCSLFKQKEKYISLTEVIPEAKIISETEGIVEYKGVTYFLGTNDLKKKKELIESLNLLNLENSLEIDLRFSRQIIIRKAINCFNTNRRQ